MRNIIIKKEAKHKKQTTAIKEEVDENKTKENTDLLDIRGKKWSS